jgi:hypothetical protein
VGGEADQHAAIRLRQSRAARGGPGNPAHGDTGWRAVGVSYADRGRRTDDALAVLPDLVAGHPVSLDGGPRLCRPATVFDDMGEILPGGQVEEHHAPMCVTLFIETNAGDLPTQEQDRKRRAHAARPGRSGP